MGNGWLKLILALGAMVVIAVLVHMIEHDRAAQRYQAEGRRAMGQVSRIDSTLADHKHSVIVQRLDSLEVKFGVIDRKVDRLLESRLGDRPRRARSHPDSVRPWLLPLGDREGAVGGDH